MGLVDFVKKYPKLFFIARCIKNINNPAYHKLINEYFDMQGDSLFLLIDHSYRFSEEPVAFDISFGETTSEAKGFWALMYWTIWYIWFANKMNFKPNVFWGPGCAYYDPEMDTISKNAFEYYFEQVSDVDRAIMNQKYPICRCNARQMSRSGFHLDSYSDFNEENMPMYAMTYKNSIHLNSKTQQYIDAELSKIFIPGKVLGVHVRGTDFKKGFKNHPIAVTFRTYLDKTKELFSTGKYEKIFLATDDIEALELFYVEFKEKLVTYSDAFRTEGKCSPHTTDSNRPFHHYKLGLEVLRDVYTLANCDGLVCGLSNVSFAARYISMSMDKKYDDIVVLDNGISKENSKAVKKASN